ncbi:beta-glucosidase BglX [Lactiplantibacillus fabifermentans]|uniref:beta-glucosidase n=2 Tax=Lactiplantibacillus fabifermentans TaxID=483011 RepID=A0A0R2NSV9_9LACO|nr:beta-glucosidase BglX [Lactiplantibacillus fabifermentans]ETY75723.1 glycosyl hydrolase family 3 [Lactiplantibacillus fabifermentans T30PCM01]KRO28756.1 Beta-glucosidase-related glycosidase [Lactiplantibacillus fabifermentans DSM 21115]
MNDKKLHALLDDLSLKEKIGQLVQLPGEFFAVHTATTGPEQKLGITPEVVDMCGSVLNVAGAEKTRQVQDKHLKKSRIPLLFMSDIIYGFKTIYPIPLGLGATWDPELIEKDYQNTADEAQASGNQVAFAPMVDLVRDARWGRVLESTGEDPYLNSQFASAMVRGFQHDFDKQHGIAACVKHFAAYGAVESGKEYNSVEMSERKLRQEYLPSYKAAVDAGTKLVMTAFNTMNGVPVTGNKWLLKDILREEWGFDGIIISDYAAVAELVNHGFVPDNHAATQCAFNATVDIDMKSPCYANELQPLLAEGRIDLQKVDEACWRVLKLKNDMGLFEDPYRGASAAAEAQQLVTPQKRTLARKTADEASVLLKNDGILPLSTDKKIALIGPYSSSQELIGLWAVHGDTRDVISIEQAFKEKVASENLKVTSGTSLLAADSNYQEMGMTALQFENSQLTDADQQQADQDVEVLGNWADVIVMPVGEHTVQSGEAGSRTEIGLPAHQVALIKRVAKFGKPIVLVTISGRPLVLTDVATSANAILQAWFPGTEGGHAIADIIFGDVNPSGRLSMGFPRAVGQLPQYYSHLSTGRSPETSGHSSRFMSKYIDAADGPLYPFGYGLSYHHAKYHDLTLNRATMMADQTLQATVALENESDVAGTETVQLYLQDMFASVVQPVKALKAYHRVTLAPHEQKNVTFTIDVAMLKFYNQQNQLIAEPGKFKLFVGANSQDNLTTTFEYI